MSWLTLYALSLGFGFLSTGVLVLRLRAWRSLGRFLSALLPLALLATGARLAQSFLDAPNYDWSGARLSPVASLKYGYQLYQSKDSGPVFNTLYTPLSYLVYAPIVVLSEPVPMILLAMLIGVTCFFAPVLVFCVKEAGHAGAAWALHGFFAFALLAFQLPCLRVSLEGTIHDCPSLALTAAAYLVLYFDRTGRPRSLALAALLSALAFWSKQVMLPAALALPLWTLASHGPKKCVQHLLLLAGAGVLLGLGFLAACDGPALLFNVFVLPASHPWNGRFPLNLGTTAFYFYREAVVLVVVLVLICWVERRPSAAVPFRAWLAHNRWCVFVLAGLADVPTAMLGRLKLGGAANSFSPTVYFLLLALLAYVLRLVGERRQSGGPRLAFALCTSAFLLLVLQQQVFFFRDCQGLAAAKEQQVFAFLQRHPGSAYFPWNPLPHLLAEGRPVHFSYGLFDREVGGFRISPQHFQEYVPLACRYVCFPVGRRQHRPPQCLLSFLQQFPRRMEIPELPGFECYERQD